MAARVRLLALLVLASVLVSASGFARALYVCRMTGRVGPACCCAHGKKPPGKVPELRRADCCEVAANRAPSAVASADSPDQPKLPPAALVAVLEPPVPLAGRAVVAGWAPARERGPPPPRAKVFLQNCTLLV